MTRTIRGAALAALGASILLVTAGCSGSSDSGAGNGDSGGKVSMTLWTNATTGPGAKFFEDTVKSFETANTNVTIKIQRNAFIDIDAVR